MKDFAIVADQNNPRLEDIEKGGELTFRVGDSEVGTATITDVVTSFWTVTDLSKPANAGTVTVYGRWEGHRVTGYYHLEEHRAGRTGLLQVDES